PDGCLWGPHSATCSRRRWPPPTQREGRETPEWCSCCLSHLRYCICCMESGPCGDSSEHSGTDCTRLIVHSLPELEGKHPGHQGDRRQSQQHAIKGIGQAESRPEQG